MGALLTILWGSALWAHETQPAIANIDVAEDRVEIALAVNAEAILAGVDQSLYSDTNDAPEAEEYDRLRALSGDDLQALLEAGWEDIATTITLEGAGALELANVNVIMPASEELARETVLTVSAPLDDEAEGVRFSWAQENGDVIIRQSRDGATYAA
ncbi:MAG: HupE/UreJ family protein, partial [Pseudomonadota bacterium]